MTDLLTGRGIVKRFGGITAINGLDFAVPEGSVFGIMGPNGAGKTALLNVITGLYRADGGSIHFDGDELVGRSAHGIARLGLARTFQNVRLFSSLTMREQVLTGMHQRRRFSGWQSILLDPRERTERRACGHHAEELLAQLGLSDVDRFAETLSYGDQRRVEIARALASEPRLLLLDEPTAGMNPAEAAALGELILQVRDGGVTVLLIEHNMKLIADYCDEALVINFGEPLATGAPLDCIANSAVQDAYFGRRSDAERVEALRVLRRDRGR